MKKIIEVIRPYIFQPLSRKGCLLRNRKINNFFLSFSDAFFCILDYHKISKKKDIILMPNFYCIETLNFIGKFLNIIFYKINNDFSVNKIDYFQQIEKQHPKLILNYSFLGFSLTPQEKKYLISLCKKGTIIIDDCSHKIISDEETRPVHKNYYYIDSIKKHCSLLGSHLINPDFNHDCLDVESINYYKFKCQIPYFFYKVLILFTYIFRSKKIFLMSEKLFRLFNKNISNPPYKPTLGPLISFYLYGFINFKKIKKHNKSIIHKLSKYFTQLKNPKITSLSQDNLSYCELQNYFPVFIEEKIQSQFNKFLEKYNIFPWRLWDIQETQYLSELNIKLYTSFLVLPVHWLITNQDVKYICETIDKFTKTIKNYE